MSTNWNLDSLYTSHKSDEFLSDIKNFQKELKELNSWAKESFNSQDNAKEKLEYYIDAVNKISKYKKISSYLHLSLSTDTTNSELLALSSKIDELFIENKKHCVAKIKFLKEIQDLDKLIDSSRILKEHEFILKEFKAEGQYTLSSQEEQIIAKMSLNGGSLWTKQWKQLTSTLEVDYEGKILTLPEIRNLAYSDSQEVRKSAYYSELKSYERIALPAAFSLNGVKGEVIEQVKIRGFNSPLAMTLEQSRLDEEVFDAMISAIKKSLPKLREYFIKKAQLLGHKDGLPFYDLFAPIGTLNRTFNYEQAKDFVYENFLKFSQKLGNFAKKAFDNDWLDVYPKKGKVGGAFCSSVHSIKESRILLNFSGSLDNVLTIAHELGHGYHNLNLFDESYLNSHYSMPIAETASTLCESIIINSALENATDDEKVTILENSISGNLQCIVDIYSRFLFEDTVFNNREGGFISQEKLCKIMENAQKEAYGKGLNHEFLHKYMWICKPHYYYGDTNYYNFPYAYGTLFSKGLFALYLKDKENFVQKYDKMLSITGKSSLYEVGKFIGVNVKTEEFWLSSLNLIIQEIEEYCKL